MLTIVKGVTKSNCRKDSIDTRWKTRHENKVSKTTTKIPKHIYPLLSLRKCGERVVR